MLYGNPEKNVENLTSLFLETPFSVTSRDTYRRNGFLSFVSLVEIFKNKYTNISGDKLQVRAMKAEDIYNVTGLSKMQMGKEMDIANVKYNKLLVNGSSYWLASYFKDLYILAKDGYISNLDHTYENIGIRPVISLNSLVKANNTDILGAWNIEI